MPDSPTPNDSNPEEDKSKKIKLNFNKSKSSESELNDAVEQPIEDTQSKDSNAPKKKLAFNKKLDASSPGLKKAKPKTESSEKSPLTDTTNLENKKPSISLKLKENSLEAEPPLNDPITEPPLNAEAPFEESSTAGQDLSEDPPPDTIEEAPPPEGKSLLEMDFEPDVDVPFSTPQSQSAEEDKPEEDEEKPSDRIEPTSEDIPPVPKKKKLGLQSRPSVSDSSESKILSPETTDAESESVPPINKQESEQLPKTLAGKPDKTSETTSAPSSENPKSNLTKILLIFSSLIAISGLTYFVLFTGDEPSPYEPTISIQPKPTPPQTSPASYQVKKIDKDPTPEPKNETLPLEPPKENQSISERLNEIQIQMVKETGDNAGIFVGNVFYRIGDVIFPDSQLRLNSIIRESKTLIFTDSEGNTHSLAY